MGGGNSKPELEPEPEKKNNMWTADSDFSKALKQKEQANRPAQIPTPAPASVPPVQTTTPTPSSHPVDTTTAASEAIADVNTAKTNVKTDVTVEQGKGKFSQGTFLTPSDYNVFQTGDSPSLHLLSLFLFFLLLVLAVSRPFFCLIYTRYNLTSLAENQATQKQKPVILVAMHDFVEEEDDDLGFLVGDILIGLRLTGDWWTGHHQHTDDVVAHFPKDFVIEKGREAEYEFCDEEHEAKLPNHLKLEEYHDQDILHLPVSSEKNANNNSSSNKSSNDVVPLPSNISHPDDEEQLYLQDLQDILRASGRDPSLANEILDDYDKDDSGGVSLIEYEAWCEDNEFDDPEDDETAETAATDSDSEDDMAEQLKKRHEKTQKKQRLTAAMKKARDIAREKIVKGKVLNKVEGFSTLKAKAHALILNVLELETYPRGTVIAKQGECFGWFDWFDDGCCCVFVPYTDMSSFFSSVSFFFR